MRIDEQFNPVFARLLDHRPHVVEIGFVVFAGTGVLNRLPRHQKAQEGQSPRFQAAQMLVRLVEWERSPDERDAPVLEKVVAAVGRAIGHRGDFAAPAQIHAPQNASACIVVFQPNTIRIHEFFQCNLIERFYSRELILTNTTPFAEKRGGCSCPRPDQSPDCGWITPVSEPRPPTSSGSPASHPAG